MRQLSSLLNRVLNWIFLPHRRYYVANGRHVGEIPSTISDSPMGAWRELAAMTTYRDGRKPTREQLRLAGFSVHCCGVYRPRLLFMDF